MINKLFKAIKREHPQLKMEIAEDTWIIIKELDELLIKEVDELLYSNPALESISDVEWTYVEQYGYMAVSLK